MTKTDLIDGLAGEANLTKVFAKACIDYALGTVADALARGEPVHLAGFGNFDLRLKEARTGKTFGRAFDRPAHHVVRFRAAKALAERLPAPTPDAAA
ncbi:HU family DNA-binding protein [uncultured Lamprocystis sp.]|jgi:nucleoid DNA-binding protein|uniref:HU family DNA-binding protein n=1 Tax=uncultured Lamprocystis sp. TaxID=543132 RepID=UPI0025CCD50B|nr:HU family DNA-binding protein [uncultured Lamprocystis sp.]